VRDLVRRDVERARNIGSSENDGALAEGKVREYQDASAQAGHWIIANGVVTRDDAIVARRDGHVVIDDPG
jgi:hypothetical protein